MQAVPYLLGYLEDPGRWLKGRLGALKSLDKLHGAKEGEEGRPTPYFEDDIIATFEKILKRTSTQLSLAQGVVSSHLWKTAVEKGKVRRGREGARVGSVRGRSGKQQGRLVCEMAKFRSWVVFGWVRGGVRRIGLGWGNLRRILLKSRKLVNFQNEEISGEVGCSLEPPTQMNL